MTGPEHFKAAEGLLGQAAETSVGTDLERYCIAAAQVHATLALAAATVTGLTDHPGVDWDEWRPAVSRVVRPGDQEAATAAGTEN